MSQNTWATKEVSTQLNVEDKGGREHILLPYKEYSAECKKNILQCKICVYLERKPSNSNEGEVNGSFFFSFGFCHSLTD